jgi:integrase
MLKQLEHIATLPTIRLGMRLYLLTMVRKSELQDAVWDEVDFENAVWTIPKERMKRSKAHNVYLSQVLDIMIALKTCAGNSKYLLPSRYDADAPMSRHLQPSDLRSRRTGEGGRFAPGAVELQPSGGAVERPTFRGRGGHAPAQWHPFCKRGMEW